MASFAPTSAETLEDQRLYTQARLTEVACLDCLAQVGGEEEQRAPHLDPVERRGAASSAPEFRRWTAARGAATCTRLLRGWSLDRARRRRGADRDRAEDGY